MNKSKRLMNLFLLVGVVSVTTPPIMPAAVGLPPGPSHISDLGQDEDTSLLTQVVIDVRIVELMRSFYRDAALPGCTENAEQGPCEKCGTKHSKPELCAFPEPGQNIVRLLDPLLELSRAATARLFGSVVPCGTGPAGLTVCASSRLAPSGRYVFLIAEFKGDIPLKDEVQIYQYAFVFDADGRANNNFQPSPQFPNDFFAFTDKWYELNYNPQAGWRARVRDVRRRLAEVPSDARFVIAGRELAIFIPVREFDIGTPTFRATAFCHTGDFGLQGGPWSGDYFPLVRDPLLPVAMSDSVIVIDQ